MVSNTANAITVLAGAKEQILSWQQQLVASSASAEQYNASVAKINAQLGILQPHIPELTQAQLEYAQSLVKSGANQDQLSSALAGSQEIMDRLANASRINGEAINQNAAGYDAFAQTLLRVNAAGAEGQQVAEGLIRMTIQENYTMEQATSTGQAFLAFKAAHIQATEQQTQVTQTATVGMQLFTAELVQNASDSAVAQAQTEALKVQQDALYQAALAAANGQQAAGASAIAMANQFGIAESAAYNLISALAQLENAKAAQESAKVGGPRSKDYDYSSQFRAAVATVGEQTKAYEAQQKQNYALADTAGKLKIVTNQLKGLKQGTAEYINKQTEQLQLQKQLEKAQDTASKPKKGKAPHDPTYDVPKLTTNEKLNRSLLDQQDKYDTKFEDQEVKHLQRLEQIYADYNKKILEQQSQNEIGKRRSRADFYANNADLPKGVDPNQFASDYEEAFNKAQQIAQSGQAKLAKDFLDLRQKQIEEMRGLAVDAANIQNDKALSKKDKQAQLEYLNGRKKLVQEAQDEELKQLMNGGDSINNDLQDRLDAENKQYADQVEQISKSAGDAADAKIAHAQRSKIAVDNENTSLATQLGLYKQIGTASNNGTALSANSTVTTTPDTTTATPITADTPIPISADTPLPISSVDGLAVRQLAVWLVRDQDVVTAIGDMATRLEGKIGEVVTAVNTAKDEIKGAVGDVRTAVSNIKIQTTSVLSG